MKLCVINNSAAHYREPIYRLIDNTCDTEFYLGKISEIKSMDISALKKAKLVGNHTFIRRPFYYLSGVVPLLWRNDIGSIIMTGETPCLSMWAMLLLRPIVSRRKNLYIWTHGWYGREGFFKKWANRFRTFLCKGVFTYGEYARKVGIEQGNNPDKLMVIHNSLDHARHIEIRNDLRSNAIFRNYFNNDYPTLIFIGRLTKVKKLDMLIESLNMLKAREHNYNLVLVGDGPERDALAKMAESYGLEKSVWFYGACYDETRNAELIYNADVCVSPGNVGLTAIHSMTFGTPVITHDDFKNQMPEFEAITDGVTGAFFKEKSVDSLASTIENWFTTNGDKRDAIRSACFKEIDENWTPEYQIEVLKKGLKL